MLTTLLPTVVLLGTEGVGKTRLAQGLSNRSGSDVPLAVAGSTVACERYETATKIFLDTPGLMVGHDAMTSAATLAALGGDHAVLLVISARRITDDLRALWRLIAGRRGALVITHADQVDPLLLSAAIERLAASGGITCVGVDARHLTATQVEQVMAALSGDARFAERVPVIAWTTLVPRRGPLEWPLVGPFLALIVLVLPAWIAVQAANSFAAVIEPPVIAGLASLADAVAAWPEPFAALLAGRYGLLTMGPLLFVWALPTVVVFAVLMAVAKASGLVDRTAAALHPWLRPFGLGGRELVRVLMGFGCNVPAVVATRSCSACTRDTCLHTIAFGAACSYQFGATLAVFAAARQEWLVLPYLLWLGLTTLVYSRLISPAATRAPSNRYLNEGRVFLCRPELRVVASDAWGVLRSFLFTALPIFLGISLLAGLLDWSGGLAAFAQFLAPVMAAVGLPGDTSTAVVLAAIRKDGILLLGEPQTIAHLTAAQVLVATYLAGVLLPCLVTALTIARERTWLLAGKLVGRQMVAALVFTALLAWLVLPAAQALGWFPLAAAGSP